jgi:hypothetical protein
MKKIVKMFLVIGALLITTRYANAQISVGISVRLAPPELPVYVQPACPVDGYLWQPGYWAYDDADGYYWVPGVWIAPPSPGLLWTPAYWDFDGGYYGYHAGYWGPHVGFYGGINYGFGYGGIGFVGGSWSGNSFRYNTAVLTVNTTIVHNTYVDRTVINNVTVNNHTSYNGPGGVNVKPRPEELAAMKEQHVQPTSQQLSHQQAAHSDKSQFANVNGGHPAAAAMNKVGGKPIDEHGQVATNSKLGGQNAGGYKNQQNKPNNDYAKPATNAAGKPNNGYTKPQGAAMNQPNGVKPQNNGGNKPAQRLQRPPQHQNKPQPEKPKKE